MFCFVGCFHVNWRLALQIPIWLYFGVVTLASLVILPPSELLVCSRRRLVWMYPYVLIFPMMRCPYCALVNVL